MSDIHPQAEALERLHRENQAIEAAMQEAVNDAVLVHQRHGLPMVEWQDGKIVLVPPEQLAVDDQNAAH